MHARKTLSVGNRTVFAWLLVCCLLAFPLAGCFSDGEDQDGDPVDPGNGTSDPDPGNGDPADPPEVFAVLAQLDVDRLAGWAVNDTFTFDASNTTIFGDGEVVLWKLDLGDGSEPAVIDAGEDPVIEHVYDEGGVYFVNLTVEAESADGNDTATDSASVAVYVSERFWVEGEELTSIFLIGDEESWDDSFPVRAGAFAFNVSLQVEDTGSFTGSEGSVTFTAPGDEESLEAREYDLDRDEATEVSFSAELNLTDFQDGDYKLEVVLETGQIAFSGVVSIYYGIDPATLE